MVVWEEERGGEAELSLLSQLGNRDTITELLLWPPSLSSELIVRRCFKREMYSASAPKTRGSMVVARGRV